MSFEHRTHACGDLRQEHVGQEVVLCGWAHKIRDLGGLLFIDLRDRTGLVQLMIDPDSYSNPPEIRTESCLCVTGTVRERDEQNKNGKMATGDIEVLLTAVTVLNQAKTLPFPISDEEAMRKVNEELRVKYRYLDLRRPAMHRKMAIRTKAVSKIRRFLDDQGFYELETPVITRATPEGARDYLVPYRLEPGKFYALPQSPQQYKQLLMVAGFEKYYQIARCFRDEAQRADRQPEFTQLDLEMSFATQEDVLTLIEGMTRSVINELIEEFSLEKDPVQPFARMTFDEAVRDYGSDKPDVRFDLKLFDISELVAESGFGVFKNTIEGGGKVRGVRYPGGSSLSRKQIGELESFAKEYGAKGLATIAVDAEGEKTEASQDVSGGRSVRSNILKFLSADEIEGILKAADAQPGDLLCFIADEYMTGSEILARLRNEIAKRAGLRDSRKLAFAFIVDFPLVFWDAENNRWDPSHHPFTSPKQDDVVHFDTDPGKIRADCYDVVCNGVEWASGSVRIYQPEVQAKVFELIGVGEKEQQEKFSHILEAFQFGAPPHAGIAPGIDRMIMFLTDDENIREVIPFPKVGNGYDPMMDAPSTIDPQQWAEMGLRLSQ
ncbi:MAG: aspartate--tRNA ligase [Fimbriimonadaceae bacterium]